MSVITKTYGKFTVTYYGYYVYVPRDHWLDGLGLAWITCRLVGDWAGALYHRKEMLRNGMCEGATGPKHPLP